jgi:hypothetical protein
MKVILSRQNSAFLSPWSSCLATRWLLVKLPELWWTNLELQHLYLHRIATKPKDEEKHPCLKQDSNPWHWCPSGQEPRLRPRNHCDRGLHYNETITTTTPLNLMQCCSHQSCLVCGSPKFGYVFLKPTTLYFSPLPSVSTGKHCDTFQNASRPGPCSASQNHHSRHPMRSKSVINM